MFGGAGCVSAIVDRVVHKGRDRQDRRAVLPPAGSHGTCRAARLGAEAASEAAEQHVSRHADPVPPRPQLERRPRGSFGWSRSCLEAELLHGGWLTDLGPNAVLLQSSVRSVPGRLRVSGHGHQLVNWSRLAEPESRRWSRLPGP